LRYAARDDACPQTVHPTSTAGLVQVATQRAKVRHSEMRWG
jgi:hypothetical protein